MQALTVEPKHGGSLRVHEVPDPRPGAGEMLVAGLAMGVCGTDKEIARGEYGEAPPGHDRLVLGHESLGRVISAPSGSGFVDGDLVVGVVRRPDPEPCGACAHGEFDMCRNGRYRERGIKSLDGFGSEKWCVETEYAVKLADRLASVGVLLEPLTIVTKAWEQVHKIGERAWFEPQTVLVTGAGPIGLLAALLGVQQNLDVHVLDRVSDGPKPDLVAALGATYHNEPAEEVAGRLAPDIVIEATGASRVVFETLCNTNHYGIVCLTGVSSAGRRLNTDIGALNRELVLENDAVVGSVNANLRHYRHAADAMARADISWLERLITRRVPLSRAPEAFDARDNDVKVVIDLDEGADK